MTSSGSGASRTRNLNLPRNLSVFGKENMYEKYDRALRNMHAIFDRSSSNVTNADTFARVLAFRRLSFLSMFTICFSIFVFVVSPPRFPAAMSAADASS